MAFAAFNALESSVSPLVKRVLSYNTDPMNPQEQGPIGQEAQKALDDAASNMTSAKSGESGLVVQTVQTVQSVTSVYNENADVIGSASHAIKDLVQSELVKKTPNDLLAVAEKMTNALDVVTESYPIVGSAAVAFKVIVNLELQRRENDRRVGLMLVNASDMMSIFLQLKDVKDTGRLQGVIKDIAQDVHDCGIAIDKYWKSKFIVRLFRSEHWADEFLNICNGFSDRKKQLEFELNIVAAVKVDTMINKMDQLIKMQSEREQKFEKQRGGIEKCLESPDQFGKLLDTSELLEGRPQNILRTDGRSASEQDHVDVSLLLHELKTPLQDLFKENRASFKLAYDKQNSLIKESISSSEERIIQAINSNNVFRQVKDPHLQYIWEQMKWRPVVKTEYFIAELHDYFMNRFSRIHAQRAQVKSGASSVPDISNPDSEVEEKLPAIDPADKWCLKYLTNLYTPGLCEGFDSDANRLVSIRDVNAFTSAKPRRDWSLLQKLVYWAAGWWVDSQYYCICIQAIMESMVKVQLGALPENRRYIARYLDSFAIKDVTLLIRSLAEVDSDDSDLTRLAARHRKAQEDDLEAKLDGMKYCIDSTDAIKHFGSGRIENSLLPLLYLVLKRHIQIMKVAKTEILDERELHFATQSIQNIFGGVDLRVKQLEVIFRQQGTDPKMRFAWYSHGLYNIWYNPDLNLETEDGAWVTDNCEFDDAKLEINTSILKFGPFNLTEAKEPLERPVQLVLSNSGQESQSAKEEFIRLWCLNELQKGCWTIPYDDTPICITPDEKRRFDSLSKKLPPADVRYWSSSAELHLRTRATSTYCDACHWPIIDAIHHCIDCENDNYNLCVECESLAVSNHKYTFKHKATHNMLVFRVRRPQVLRRQAVLDARKILSTLSLVTAPPKGLLPTGDNPSKTQSDGAVLDTGTSVANKGTSAECLLNSVFYVCLVCELGENKDQVTMCHDAAKKHDETHHLLKIKDRVQDTNGTSGEPIEGVESSASSSLSSRVDTLTTMVESRFVELDRRLAELMEKVSKLG